MMIAAAAAAVKKAIAAAINKKMEQTYVHRNHGVCSRTVTVVYDGDIVKDVRFDGGCHGNTQGVGALCKGRRIDELIAILKGIDCKGRGTSCPDQLALALEEIQHQKQ